MERSTSEVVGDMKDGTANGPWMVTLVQTHLDEMAGACNALHRDGREIKFIVPVAEVADHSHMERCTSHIAIFTLPKESPE